MLPRENKDKNARYWFTMQWRRDLHASEFWGVEKLYTSRLYVQKLLRLLGAVRSFCSFVKRVRSNASSLVPTRLKNHQINTDLIMHATKQCSLSCSCLLAHIFSSVHLGEILRCVETFLMLHLKSPTVNISPFPISSALSKHIKGKINFHFMRYLKTPKITLLSLI